MIRHESSVGLGAAQPGLLVGRAVFSRPTRPHGASVGSIRRCSEKPYGVRGYLKHRRPCGVPCVSIQVEGSAQAVRACYRVAAGAQYGPRPMHFGCPMPHPAQGGAPHGFGPAGFMGAASSTASMFVGMAVLSCLRIPTSCTVRPRRYVPIGEGN